MNPNEQLITRFYTAFQQMDYKTMQDCYHDDAIFYDPAFENLDAAGVRAMWEMLCKRAVNFSLVFDRVEADEEYGTCYWTATYNFSKTGRKVVNRIKAHLRFADGKIIEHTDDFDLYKWSRMALGLPGILLGWTSWMQGKIRKQSREMLRKWREKE
jgi:ketosteroid isomerase-like protein